MSTPPHWDPQSGLLVMKSPFLLMRFVILSLLIYLNFTALLFAIWNASANRAAGVHGGGASALIIFNGIATCLCVVSAMMDLNIAFYSTSMIVFEFVWTAIFAILQIAACIFVTLTGPPEFCETKAPISVCASITILVPISWLAATLLLGYFVTLSTLCITHLRVHPDLWFTPIYEIVWFVEVAEERRSSAPQLPPLNTTGTTRLSVMPRRHSTSSVPQDVENQLAGNLNLEKPLPSPAPSTSNVWWARLLPGRPGRDHPFRFRRTRGPELRWWVKPGEDSGEANDDQGTDDGDPPKYPGLQPQSPGETQFLPHPPRSLNEDEPIPVDNRSEWVHAEQALRS